MNIIPAPLAYDHHYFNGAYPLHSATTNVDPLCHLFHAGLPFTTSFYSYFDPAYGNTYRNSQFESPSLTTGGDNDNDTSQREIALQVDSRTPQEYPFQGYLWSAPIQSITEPPPEDSNNIDHIPQTQDDDSDYSLFIIQHDPNPAANTNDTAEDDPFDHNDSLDDLDGVLLTQQQSDTQ